MRIKVSVIQTPLTEKRKSTVSQWLKSLLNNETPDLVVLPEMWLTGFNTEEENIKKSEEFLCEVLELSRNHPETLIIPGTFPEKTDSGVFNTAYTIKDGNVIHKRRKLCLFSLMEETKLYIPGDEPKTFYHHGMKITIVICYELRFPRIFDKLIQQEPHAVVVLAQWPENRIEHWRSLLKARAIEGQFFVIAANTVGKNRRLNFCGCSCVINPWGQRIIEARNTPGAFTCTIDLEEISAYKKLFNIAEDVRRFLQA